jgi:anthranilate phosphoribosyltransferase
MDGMKSVHGKLHPGGSSLTTLMERLRPLLSEEAVPPPEAVTALTRLLRLNGRLCWKDTVQAIRLLIAATAPESSRLNLLREMSPQRATGEMLAAAAGVLRSLAPRVPFHSDEVFDCCGTGGDRLGYANISTLAAIVIAAAGVPVAKHGNRAITSGCGSADLLEALGIPIEQGPEETAQTLKEAGIAFLFAPLYHRATRNVQPLRLKLRQEGIPTLFNLLGPLSNPLTPKVQLTGVYHPRFLLPVAQALSLLGCERGWVVCGSAGEDLWMDEISPGAATYIVEFGEGGIRERIFTLEEVGFTPIPLPELRGGDVTYSVKLAHEVLGGVPSARLEAVSLNAGASLFLTRRAETFAEGIELARELIHSGKARAVVERWARMGHSVI